MTGERRSSQNSVTHVLLFFSLAFSLLFIVRVAATVLPLIRAGRNDFAPLYSSSRLVIEGKGEQLYDQQVQYEIQADLFERGESGPLVFYYLSYITLLWIPLALVPYLAAFVLWAVFNIAIIITLSRLLPHHLPHTQAAFTAPMLLPMLGFFPLAITLLQGQASILMLLFYSAAFILLNKDRPYLAGAVLALGLFKFQLVLPFVGIYLLLRQWRFVLGFLAGSIIPLGLSIYISGWQSLAALIGLVVRANQNLTDPLNQQEFNVSPSDMPNLRGLLYKLLMGVLSEKVVIMLVIACSAGVVLWVLKRGQKSVDMTFAVTLMVTLLVSYHLHMHDLTLMLIPAFILVNRSWADAYTGDLKLFKLVLLTSPAYIFLFDLGIISLVALVIGLLAYKAGSYTQ